MRIKSVPWTLVAIAVCLTPLLAVEQGKAPSLPKDNNYCLGCHINFEKEDLASTHLKQGVTCARCHGASMQHMDDEECATPPDVLFGRAEIDPFCRKCHAAHKDPKAVEKFLAEWKGKRRPNGRLIGKDAVCTDCHGTHRLPGVGAGRSGLK